MKQYSVKLLQCAANQLSAFKGVCSLKFSILRLYEVSYI